MPTAFDDYNGFILVASRGDDGKPLQGLGLHFSAANVLAEFCNDNAWDDYPPSTPIPGLSPNRLHLETSNRIWDAWQWLGTQGDDDKVVIVCEYTANFQAGKSGFRIDSQVVVQGRSDVHIFPLASDGDREKQIADAIARAA